MMMLCLFGVGVVMWINVFTWLLCELLMMVLV